MKREINTRDDLIDAVLWAGEVFSLAVVSKFGLDEGQRRMLLEATHRLDQLAGELLEED